VTDGPQPAFAAAPASLVGLCGRHDMTRRETIAGQWRRFAAEGGTRLAGVVWGACFDFDERCFSYLCAVADEGPMPAGWRRVGPGPADWAVFPHDGAVDALPQTLATIHRRWLPGSGRRPAAAIEGGEGFLERYGTGFDPGRGAGDVSIWLPLEPL